MAKEDEKNKENNNKKFIKDLKNELKKVSWPTTKQLITNTTAVIVIVLITAAIVFVLDVAFKTINKYGVEGIKSVITSNETTEDSDDTEIANEENNSELENESNSDNGLSAEVTTDNGVEVSFDTVNVDSNTTENTDNSDTNTVQN